MNKPLKKKVFKIKGVVIEGLELKPNNKSKKVEIPINYKKERQIFLKDDVKSAVEWLKKELSKQKYWEELQEECLPFLNKKINQAFEDVK